MLRSQYLSRRNTGAVAFQNDSQKRKKLLKVFWLFVIMIFLFLTYSLITKPIINVFCASLICFSALIPGYLWCKGQARGLPIFPLYALTHTWTYGFPLINNDHLINMYDSKDIFIAGLTVAGFLFLGTFIWLRMIKAKLKPPVTFQVLKERKGDRFFLASLASGFLFLVIAHAGLLNVPAGVFTLIRGITMGLSTLALFILSYRWGQGLLPRNLSFIFWVLMIGYLIAQASSLLLIGSLSSLMIIFVAISIGRGKIPLAAIIVILSLMTVLHAGKHDMRERYWGVGQNISPGILEYPGFFTEWIGHGFENLSSSDNQNRQSLIERAGLMYLLLETQTATPDRVPYLYGATYVRIPEQFIPRIFYSEKTSSHEGTVLLNIHYGIQTRETAATTSIGWGLLNEAYANFGFIGVIALAIIVGILYSKATNLSIDTPLYSFRYLSALLLLSLCFSVEISTGAFIAAFFQYFTALLIVNFLFMKKVKANSN
jgi:hypothetical protein